MTDATAKTMDLAERQERARRRLREFVTGEQGAYDAIAADIAIVLSALSDAARVREEALEEAARVVAPSGDRPCDCDRCYCGNHGDMEAVAAWDEATANAKAIRALTQAETEGSKP